MRELWALGQWRCVREDQDLRLIFGELDVAVWVVNTRSGAKQVAAEWRRSIRSLIDRDTQTPSAKRAAGATEPPEEYCRR